MRWCRLHSIRLICAAFALCALASARAEDAAAKVRTEFQQAYSAAATGAPIDASADSSALKRYALYPYLQAARLASRLGRTSGDLQGVDDEAQQFLEAHGHEPVTRDLRSAWLQSLANRSLWTAYLAHYDPQRDTDDAARCNSFVAHIETQQTTGLIPEVRSRWLTAAQLPEACEPAFTWLRAQNAVTLAMFDQRVRMILREGNAPFARQIIAQMPAEPSAPLLEWAALIQRPDVEIERAIANPATPIENEALLDGWTRFVRARPDVGMQRYSAFVTARHLDREHASPYALALALSLSWSRRVEALDYYEYVSASDRDERTLEWQTRTALWTGNWNLVKRTIAAMPERVRATARWQYWLARAQEAGGERDAARSIYESVLTDDSYYSALAAARIDATFRPHPEETTRDNAVVEGLDKQPGFARARELYLCNLRNPAIVEWQTAAATAPAEQQTQLIHLARGWGWYELAIQTSVDKRLYNDYRLLFPHPFDDEMKAAVERTGLDRDLLYGLMRQESRYRPEAISPAGAVGLLQLHPDTAKRTARAAQLGKITDAALLEPKTNILIGALQLKSLQQRFDDQTPVMLAGYNAGPNAAARWLPAKPMDADVWVENIPYNETRTYVQRVLWQRIVFAWLRTGAAQDTKGLLAAIGRDRGDGSDASDESDKGKNGRFAASPK